MSAVNPPQPIQLNLGNLESQATAADQAAYAAGDQYVNQYYPALAQGRNQMIAQAYRGITGPTPAPLENAFVNQGNMGAIGSLGGGDQSFGLGAGSLARNSAAASVASNEQTYQDYNRSLFEQLNTMYAPRVFGLTPEDAANIFTFNNTQYNNYLEQKFAAQTQAYYTNQGLAAQQGAALQGLLSSLGTAAIEASDERFKENIKDAGFSSPEGIPIKIFQFKNDPTRQWYIGVIAQDVRKLAPNAVIPDKNGMLLVNFALIHAPYHRITIKEAA